MGGPINQLLTMHKNTPEKFWKRVDKRSPDECWLWLGPLNEDGYGERFYVNGKRFQVHVYSYTISVGPVPPGLQLDHLCRVRHCVNPKHLEPVTCKVNILRGVSNAALNAKKTHCPKGHPYNSVNTYLRRGLRACRECARQRNREFSKARNKAVPRITINGKRVRIYPEGWPNHKTA